MLLNKLSSLTIRYITNILAMMPIYISIVKFTNILLAVQGVLDTRRERDHNRAYIENDVYRRSKRRISGTKRSLDNLRNINEIFLNRCNLAIYEVRYLK